MPALPHEFAASQQARNQQPASITAIGVRFERGQGNGGVVRGSPMRTNAAHSSAGAPRRTARVTRGSRPAVNVAGG
jgi:hypothetical protein